MEFFLYLIMVYSQKHHLKYFKVDHIDAVDSVPLILGLLVVLETLRYSILSVIWDQNICPYLNKLK